MMGIREKSVAIMVVMVEDVMNVVVMIATM